MLEIGDKYLIPLTRMKSIRSNYTRRIWYIDTYGHEKLDWMSYVKIDREKMTITATVFKIHKRYVELKLENHRVICFHNERLAELERLL